MRLKALGEGAFDLLVVGGGINGAGIAREAARRGLRVALVEKQDYAAGTTSRSTRLIHGGIRYLEHGELTLVLEALRERELLLRRMPHLVRPLRFVIPVYDYSSRSARLIRAGMLLYDLLSAGKTVPRHRAAGPEQLRELERQIRAPGLKGAFLYYDAQVNFPERLVVETIGDARRHGAVTLNHCELLCFRLPGRRVRGALVRDALTGAQTEVQATLTVNATGPWLEQVDALLPARRAHPLLSPTRGSHLVVGRFPGAPSDALYFEARSDHRPLFIIPWHGLFLIGTTDVPFAGDPSEVRPSPEEVEYLLAEVNAALPQARLTRGSILFAYAGVRALPYEESTEPGALTRRHILVDHEKQDGIGGVATILGGKLTTYRSLARDVVETLARKLPRETRRRSKALGAAATAHVEPELPQFATWPWQGPPEELEQSVVPMASEHRLEPAQFLRLFETYGEGAPQLLQILDEDAAMRRPLCEAGPMLAGEVAYAARHEQALTLGDVLLRRTCAGLSADRGANVVPAVADLLARELGWSLAAKDAALAAYAAEVDLVLPRAV